MDLLGERRWVRTEGGSGEWVPEESYSWMKTFDVFEKAAKIGASLLERGLVPLKGQD